MASNLQDGLLAHWPLQGDCLDHSGHGHHGINHGADLFARGPSGEAQGAARFDGRSAHIEVPPSDWLRLGTRDFSWSAWVHTAARLDDVLGDIGGMSTSASIKAGIRWSPTVAADVLAQRVSELSVRNGVLQIDSHTNTFALAVHPLALKTEPEELVAEMQIRVQGAVGASWAPGLYLYWEPNKWISIRNTGGVYRMEGYIEGTWVREQDFGFRPLANDSNGLRLVWKHGWVEVFASHDMQSWQFLTSVERPGAGLPWLLVGKGFSASGSGALPYLANPHSDLGGWGTTQIRQVRVLVNGSPLYADTFAEAGLGPEVWTPLLYGDPELKERIAHLNDLRRQQAE